MRIFIITDLEGVVGVDSFAQTRTNDLSEKAEGMHQLAREVNACIEGIRSIEPNAIIDVWDGHGSGGLLPEEVRGGNYLSGQRPYYDLIGHDAVMFVGQHAMAGTINAPLCHTYSSRSIAYYRLNGTFIGEFGARALVAGRQGKATIFLSGDDKAASEASMFVPEIETSVVKWGQGLEAANHRSREEACELVRQGAARSLQRMHEIPPFTAIQPPFRLEIRYYDPPDPSRWQGSDVEWLDQRTVAITANDLNRFPF